MLMAIQYIERKTIKAINARKTKSNRVFCGQWSIWWRSFRRKAALLNFKMKTNVSTCQQLHACSTIPWSIAPWLEESIQSRRNTQIEYTSSKKLFGNLNRASLSWQFFVVSPDPDQILLWTIEQSLVQLAHCYLQIQITKVCRSMLFNEFIEQDIFFLYQFQSLFCNGDSCSIMIRWLLLKQANSIRLNKDLAILTCWLLCDEVDVSMKIKIV